MSIRSTNKVFVDASVWIALALSEDAHHSRAVAETGEIIEKGYELVTSDYVLDEATTRIKKKESGGVAAKFIQNILGEKVKIVFMTKGMFMESIALFARYRGIKSLSFTDATILAMMKVRKVKRLLTFDGDLREIAGRDLDG